MNSLVQTRPPASRHTRAAAFFRGFHLRPRIPSVAHATGGFQGRRGDGHTGRHPQTREGVTQAAGEEDAEVSPGDMRQAFSASLNDGITSR